MGRNQAEILCLAHDVDRDVAVLDLRDGDATQPAVGWLAVVRDPLVVEPGEAGGELGVLERRRAEAEAGIQHHRVDLIAIGVAEHAFGRPEVDPVRGGQAVFGRASRAGPTGFRIVAALDHQSRSVRARHDVIRPALHCFDRQGSALGDMAVGVDDPHLCTAREETPVTLFDSDRAAAAVGDQSHRG